MADTEVADDGEYQEDLINDLSDDTYYDTENNCLLLDDGINACDEIQEFVKVYFSSKDSIKGQVFLNCWSLICCSVGHNIQTRRQQCLKWTFGSLVLHNIKTPCKQCR